MYGMVAWIRNKADKEAWHKAWHIKLLTVVCARPSDLCEERTDGACSSMKAGKRSMGTGHRLSNLSAILRALVLQLQKAATASLPKFESQNLGGHLT